VHIDHHAMSAFPERVRGHRRQGGVQCPGIQAHPDQPARQRLQRVQLHLPEALALHLDEVVVPLRQ